MSTLHLRYGRAVLQTRRPYFPTRALILGFVNLHLGVLSAQSRGGILHRDPAAVRQRREHGHKGRGRRAVGDDAFVEDARFHRSDIYLDISTFTQTEKSTNPLCPRRTATVPACWLMLRRPNPLASSRCARSRPHGSQPNLRM